MTTETRTLHEPLYDLSGGWRAVYQVLHVSTDIDIDECDAPDCDETRDFCTIHDPDTNETRVACPDHRKTIMGVSS